MAFSATDAAFEGFRLARERPAAVVAWSLLQLLSNFACFYVLVALAGPQYQTMAHLDPTVTLPPDQALKLLGPLMPAVGLVLLISLAIMPILTTAIYRSVLRREERGVVSLKFGPEELRQLGVSLAIWLVLFGVCFVGAMGTSILAAILTVGGPPLAALGFLVGVTATAVLAAWVLIRLSFAGPLTFDSGRLSVFQSWRLTQGRTGALLGAYVLAWLMSILVGGCFDAIFAAGAALITGKVELFGSPAVDFTSVETFFTPLRTANLVFSGAVSGLITAIIIGANARAYMQLKATPLVV